MKCKLCTTSVSEDDLRQHLGDCHSDHAYGWDMDQVIQIYESDSSNDEFYIQIAHDYFGTAIRDNSRESRIRIGKAIEEFGVDDSGNINYPKGHPEYEEK